MSNFNGLAGAVRRVFQENPDRPVDTGELYHRVAEQLAFDFKDIAKPEPIGSSGKPRSKFERQVRWVQQTMRVRGLLEKAGSVRGQWRLTEMGKARLKRISDGDMVVAYSTDLGVAVMGDCRRAFSSLNGEPIHLTLCSPPYPSPL